ncbi:hypothetical protein ACOMHD_07000 [Xanthomonas codiaei]|uniref:hypothetical protein n=1 Tax=Xanthomonas codiaei TaxID=56463 RepID=UPI0011B0DE5B|nr:hypothetical protein [Xanthomonas codiaei]
MKKFSCLDPEPTVSSSCSAIGADRTTQPERQRGEIRTEAARWQTLDKHRAAPRTVPYSIPARMVGDV